jgi:LuxR family maltose regulon positive regulatory protein
LERTFCLVYGRSDEAVDSVAPGGALLHTKLFAPTRRVDAVARPQILARLRAGLSCRLIVLAAPAGSGKTALLAEWVQEAQRTTPAPASYAWLSLDEGDNDSPRFWRYVVQALVPLFPGVASAARPLFSGTQPFSGEAAAAIILNLAAARPPSEQFGPAVLVLDDYHLIADPAIHRSVVYLIDRLPPGLRILIASRVDPPLPLARLRARGELLELRADDLRFTPAEAATFLREAMGLPLSDAEVAALEERTEGWAAGLQLAALALREQADPSSFIAAFSGSHRHILDYLLDEVLHRQPPHLVAFMLQTAILDRLCGSLCDAVLGIEHRDLGMEKAAQEGRPAAFATLSAQIEQSSYSELVLEQLERANLLLVPLDAERRWFRYHHLLADVLRHRLQREPAEQRAALHRRAAAWLEQHQMPEPAIEHYLAGSAPDDAARLVVQLDPLRALARGDASQVERWLGVVPDEVIRAYPALSLVRARLLLRARRPVAAIETWLHEAEHSLEAAGEGAGGGVRADIAATRAHLDISEGRHREAAARCAEALGQLAPDDGFGRAALTFMLGNAFNAFDDAAADRVYAEAALLGRAHGNARAAVMSLVNRALLAEQRADLRVAEQLLEQAVALTVGASDQPLPTAQAAYRLLGSVAYERNQLDEAGRRLATAIELARQSEQVFPLAMTLSALALLRQAQADEAGALAALDEARAVAATAGLQQYGQLLEARRAELQLGQGDMAAAAAWVASFDPHADWRVSSHDGRNNLRGLHLAFARVQIGLGAPDTALAVLTQLVELAGAERSPARAVEALVLRALALQSHGDQAAALRELERALQLALPAGSLRVFLDAGPGLLPLLQIHSVALNAQANPVAALVGQLLRAFGDPAAPPIGKPVAVAARPPAQPLQPLEEPLTPRELEVLRRLSEGLSSSEIAERLIVSVNTVKTQLKSVYGKLGAHSRSAALARARALGLLQP